MTKVDLTHDSAVRAPYPPTPNRSIFSIDARNVLGSGTRRLEMSVLSIRERTCVEWLVERVIDRSHTSRVLLQPSTWGALHALRGRTRVKRPVPPIYMSHVQLGRKNGPIGIIALLDL